MKIELYVESKEFTTGCGVRPSLRPARGVPASDYEDGIHSNQRFIVLPKSVVDLQNMLEKIAVRNNMEIVVYDIIRIHNSFRAFFKGIRKTPTVRIGKHRFSGNITEEQILNAINS